MNGKVPRGHIGGEGGFWQKEPNKILAEGRQGWSVITWGMAGGEEPDQVLKVTRYGGWGIQAKLTWQDSC